MSQQPCSQQQLQQSSQQQQQQQSEVEQHLRLQQELQSHQVAVMQHLANTDPEEFRNNSIACLRAKAQEHALMLNNALLRGRTTACDANANNLHHSDLVSSSDTSSSIF